MRLIAMLGVSSLLVCPWLARAAPIQPGSADYVYTNVFTTVLFPGTPFNPGAGPIQFDVFSQGTFSTEWGLQVGTSMPLEIPSVVAFGSLPTAPPIPFQILAGADQVPQLGPFVGAYSNVMQDPADPGFPTGAPSSLTSADVLVGGPFAQVLADGTFLYANDYTFAGSISGLPYPLGTQFVGTHDAEIRVQLGVSPDPMVDPVIGLILADGLITVVPEPSSFSLLLAAVAAATWVMRRLIH